ncbi:MAG TPA: alanine--tRNA ligase, partial [Actinomycetota bacterium]|nr:alanine--tRNA ligase [Actinomycetota bacterium]
METRTIRDRFFAFFEQREHQRVPSSSLVPNDPTLLLTNAGMNQFKPYFLGEQSPPFDRATSAQKCFRTTDIDEVGKTSRHLTFFEMMGNFSFGDYYKADACPWAWELVTEGYGLDPEVLWVTVYETDDEAEEIWRDAVGVRPERIVRRGKADNFWSMGVAGPCGPCSEIYADLGESFGPAADNGPAGNEDRYLEIWNLVFMQNDCNAAIEPIAELPKKNIDTGLGLERTAMVLQKAASVYETDTLGGMVERAAELTGKKYGSDDATDKGLRVLGDHGRSLTFLIADGVLPSNEERGYVLRRVMRRAIRHARLLGRDEPVLPGLVEATAELMGDAYPEVVEKKEFILEVAAREEERFSETLHKGLSLLETELAKSLGSERRTLSGDVAFQLHDTWGFPIDLTQEIALEADVAVDTDRFDKLMEGQRERARSARTTIGYGGSDGTPGTEATYFTGFEHLEGNGKVLAILEAGEGVPVAEVGHEVDLILDQTVFYAEGGGQVGDRGTVGSPSGAAEIRDTRKTDGGVFLHRAKVTTGEIAVDDELELHVDQ